MSSDAHRARHTRRFTVSVMVCLAAAASPAAANSVTHVVREGETLADIAGIYYLTNALQALLREVNGFGSTADVRAGAHLTIPLSGTFFLRMVGLPGDVAPFGVHAPREEGRVLVDLAVPRRGGGNRFLLAEIAGGSGRIVFDSAALPSATPALPHLDRLVSWRATDLDGDGDVDVLGRFDDAETGATTLYAFDGGSAAYEPRLAVSDVALAGGGIERTADGRAVFRFRAEGMREDAVLSWEQVRSGVFFSGRLCPSAPPAAHTAETPPPPRVPPAPAEPAPQQEVPKPPQRPRPPPALAPVAPEGNDVVAPIRP